MNVRIRHIPLEQVSLGMELGEDIRDSHGVILLMAGTRLVESHIASLRRRDVGFVPVAEQVAVSEQELAARREAVLARLEQLFRHGEPGEADRLLHQVILEYRLEQLP